MRNVETSKRRNVESVGDVAERDADRHARFRLFGFSTFRRFTRVHEVAPAMSIAAALLVPQFLPHEPGAVPANGVELEMVAAAIDRAPYRIGNWAGRDVPVPEAARRLLRPNAILSRRFVNLSSGMAVDIAIVHCGDSRDMLGHYPPVCYPSNGWVPTSRFAPGLNDPSDHGAAIKLTMSEIAVPARMYAFSRMSGWSEETHVRIFNFFVLPDGTITRDIEDVGLRTNWLGASIQGVAQVQVLTDAGVDVERAAEATAEILEGISALFESLGVKTEPAEPGPEASRLSLNPPAERGRDDSQS